MELLAPVGNTQNFHVALESGADAVYVGAPGFNARNLSRDLGLDEIGAMIDHCHDRDKKLYIAANSLVLEKEVGMVIQNLAMLDALKPDALIVQDMGIVRLIHEYFPNLAIHGSTLTTAHNSDSVRVMANLGCDRVVLARELTLREIAAIAERSGDTELEIFIHGAMCFSYSGLCLFSSYLGGKSGLRGQCVQPCRRGYRAGGRAEGFAVSDKRGGARNNTRGNGRGAQGKGIQGKGAPKSAAKAGALGRAEYLFSMNDLSGLEVVPALRDLGIASYKIEGRLRSAHYVEHVVRAYRIMLDSTEANFEDSLKEAQALTDAAMSRKTSTGYFFTPQPAEAISHLHSGNMGLHIGRFNKVEEYKNNSFTRLKVKDVLAVGDRLRLHIEPGGERLAYTLKELQTDGGKEIERANVGQNVRLILPEDIRDYKISACDIYKVDAKGEVYRETILPVAEKRKIVENLLKAKRGYIGGIKRDAIVREMEERPEMLEEHDVHRALTRPSKRSFKANRNARGRANQDTNLHKDLRLPFEWWLRLDNPKTVLSPLPITPDRFVLNFDKNMVRHAPQIKRYLGKNARTVVWALPPIIMENELVQTRKSIKLLIASGYRSFQIAHMSQLELFGEEKVHVYGDYSLNFLNSQAMLLATQIGLEGIQISMESDRANLYEALSAYKEFSSVNKYDDLPTRIPVGMTVYGTPPLYTARLASAHFQFNRAVVSPKDESFVVRKRDGFTQTYPTKPFSLLPYLHDLKQLGLNYAIIDLTGGSGTMREIEELASRLTSNGRTGKLPTFNYLGELK